MRIANRHADGGAEGDLTPMIDMTFQLIAFFMVLINFTDAEQNERIKLPSSELAQPPDAPLENALTIQLTDAGDVLFGGEQFAIEGLRPRVEAESQMLERLGDATAAATVIIRADADAKSGIVQQLIQICQETGFERFQLRAKQEESR